MTDLSPEHEAKIRAYMRQRATVTVPGDLIATAMIAASTAPRWRVRLRVPGARGAAVLASFLALTLLAVAALGPYVARPPERAAAAVPAEPLLLITLDDSDTFVLHPVEQDTLGPKAKPAISLGSLYRWGASGKLSTLALLTWNDSGMASGGGWLRLLDLETWTVEEHDLDISIWSSLPLLTNDGSTVLWSEGSGSGNHGMPVSYEVRRFDRDQGEVATLWQLPDNYSPLTIRLTADDELLVVLAQPARQPLVTGPPSVFVVDLERGNVLRQMELANALVGQRSITNAAASAMRTFCPASPGMPSEGISTSSTTTEPRLRSRPRMGRCAT